MCVSAIVAGVAIATAVVEGASAVISGNEQDEQSKKNATAAHEAAQAQIQQLAAKQEQMRQQSARSIFEANLEARRADAITRVSAGESGVEGASVDMILNDIERQRLQASTDAQMNTDIMNKNAAVERKAIKAQERARVASVPGSNPWATAIQVGGGILDGASMIAGRMP